MIALVLQIAWLVAFGLYMVVSGSLSDDAAFAIGVLVGIPLVGAEFLIGPLLVVALLGGSAAALHKMATANGRKR